MQRRMKLSEIRRARGFSQEYMATKLGYVRSTYAKMEENPQNISMYDAHKISKILDVSIDDIIFLDASLQNVEL